MLHDDLISVLWPGVDPVSPHEYRNSHLLASAIARPFQSAFGEEIYKGIFKKGTALFHSLIANHPFHNGNKRTAVLAIDNFLLANGYFLTLSNEKTYKLAKLTASYRENGMAHDAIFSKIEDTLRSGSISLLDLKKGKVPRGLYDQVKLHQGSIRRNPLNKKFTK